MKYIRLLRLMNEESQWDLSMKTGIPNYRISLIENGRAEPTTAERKALARALGVEEIGLFEDITSLKSLKERV